MASVSMADKGAIAPVPVIDFEPFRSGTEAERKEVARQLHYAAHEVGFMSLINHGMPREQRDRIFQQSTSFFGEEDAIKQAVAYQDTETNTGYVAVKRESLDPTGDADLKEAFNVKCPIGHAEKNRWPSRPEGFRGEIEGLYDACVELSNRVLEAFALALDMPEDFFTSRHTERNQTLRLLHYPPLPEGMEIGGSQWRAGAHSDYGSLTLLFQDDVGGLEVQSLDGEWLAVEPDPDAVLINTGDLMERWTNDIYRSTKHRVGPPPASKAHRDRYSMVFFCSPDSQCVIEPLDSCTDPERPPRYSPVTTREHLLERLNRTY